MLISNNSYDRLKVCLFACLGLNSDYVPDVQLRGNWKDFNFQLHHRLSKFEVPLVVNLKHIFELFGLYNTCFLI